MKENIIEKKSIDFAVRIVKIYKYLIEEKKENIMSKQLLKCGTSVGANVNEANFAQSKKDFISKMSIALKEARETEYWLELLLKSGYISETQVSEITKECKEINKILIAIVKTSKEI